MFPIILPDIQSQNLALTVLYEPHEPHSLDSGMRRLSALWVGSAGGGEARVAVGPGRVYGVGCAM